jgi:UDP-glucose:(heptosyl)LPS alpha-1,3-glucosyltransferase
MKVALVRQRYTDFGGAERYTSALAEHLIDAGHEVHVFAHEWKGKKKRAKDGDIVFHRVPMLEGLSVLEVVSFAVNSRRMLKRERFDIIHSFERTLYQDIYRAGDGCHREWLIQRKKIDPWYKRMTQAINPLHLGLLRIEREIFREGNYRAIIAISKRGKEEIVKHYSVPPEKITVIYNAIDTKRFDLKERKTIRSDVRKALGIPQKVPVLLFVGSGFRRKGLPAVIRALRGLDSEIRLMVIGKDRIGPYRTLAREEGVDKRVIFVGPVVDVENYYSASDLFVFPTIYEPFGNVCLEAMAAGLPVVTSRICGASEVLDEGTNGFIVNDPIDHVEIADKVRKGLALDLRTLEDCNKEMLQKHSWGRYLKELSFLYEGLHEENI